MDSANLFANAISQNIICSSDKSEINSQLKNSRSLISFEKLKQTLNELQQHPPQWLLNNSDSTFPSLQTPSNQSTVSTNETNKSEVDTQSKTNTTSKALNTNTKAISKKSASENSSSTMIIHVCDDARGTKQDFHCAKHVLLEEMAYFKTYLNANVLGMSGSSNTNSNIGGGGSASLDDMDISVHCDVKIFEWLINYAKQKHHQSAAGKHHQQSQENNELSSTNILSILISSDFLMMSSLVEKCLNYLHDNMQVVLASSLNIACLNAKLIKSLSKRFTDLEADALNDPTNKIKDSIFLCKIQSLFEDEADKNATAPSLNALRSCANSLYKCGICKKLLFPPLDLHVRCSAYDRVRIGPRGQVLYQHQPISKAMGSDWSINHQLAEWHTEFQLNWRSVYWKLRSCLFAFVCSTCGELFTLQGLTHCRYHSGQARFGKDENKLASPIPEGLYICCGLKAYRFDAYEFNKGCKVKDHVIGQRITDRDDEAEKDADSERIRLLTTSYRSIIQTPFERNNEEEDEMPNVFVDEQLFRSAKLSLKKKKPRDANLSARRSALGSHGNASSAAAFSGKTSTAKSSARLPPSGKSLTATSAAGGVGGGGGSARQSINATTNTKRMSVSSGNSTTTKQLPSKSKTLGATPCSMENNTDNDQQEDESTSKDLACRDNEAEDEAEEEDDAGNFSSGDDAEDGEDDEDEDEIFVGEDDGSISGATGDMENESGSLARNSKKSRAGKLVKGREPTMNKAAMARLMKNRRRQMALLEKRTIGETSAKTVKFSSVLNAGGTSISRGDRMNSSCSVPQPPHKNNSQSHEDWPILFNSIMLDNFLLNSSLFKPVRKWNANRSIRANQDSQRQEDLRRMRMMRDFLVECRNPQTETTIKHTTQQQTCPTVSSGHQYSGGGTSGAIHHASKVNSVHATQKEPIGGLYLKIEQKFYAKYPQHQSAASQSGRSGSQSRQRSKSSVQPFR